MQSGITASKELHDAFQSFLSDNSQRGLVAGISSSPESLVPRSTIASTSPDFSSDLANLSPHIKDDAAAYVILRQDGDDNSSKCVAVTYVPDRAPVRQKMLFASTRLTLVRELGTEYFASTLFATTADELTPAGWAKHLAHGSLSAPLTQEEQELVGIREAEAQESTGTGTRRGGHVSSGVSLPLSADAVAALQQLKSGDFALVQLQVDVPSETITLASTSPFPLAPVDLARTISSSSPRYTFYNYIPAAPETEDEPSGTPAEPATLFIYTCPAGASIKERMLYASSRAGIAALAAQQAGLEVRGKMEAGAPDEVSEDAVREEMEPRGGGANAAGPDAGAAAGAGASAGAGAVKKGFDRPKRPGRR